MEKIFSIDQMRLVFTTLLSTLAAYFTPTKGFLFALIIMFGFNIWAGMRADGVHVSLKRIGTNRKQIIKL